MYALVCFFDFFLDARALEVEVIVVALFGSGESRSKLGPPEAVLEPVLEGDGIGDSFRGEEIGSNGAPARAFSLPVTASDVTLRPLVLLAPVKGVSQSGARDLTGEPTSVLPSNLVTVGEG